jgi:hypothetical protein
VEKLLEHVEGFARREGCGFVALACGRERTEALRCYEERTGGTRDQITPCERPYADAFSSGLGLQHPEACRSCSRWRLACWFERLSGVLIVQEDT